MSAGMQRNWCSLDGGGVGTGLGDRVGDPLGTGLSPYLEASRVVDTLGTGLGDGVRGQGWGPVGDRVKPLP